MALEEAKGREASALGLAMAAGITADTAKSILAGLPKATVQTLPSDAPGGLAVVDSAPSANDLPAASTDFERGRAAAKRFSHIQP